LESLIRSVLQKLLLIRSIDSEAVFFDSEAVFSSEALSFQKPYSSEASLASEAFQKHYQKHVSEGVVQFVFNSDSDFRSCSEAFFVVQKHTLFCWFRSCFVGSEAGHHSVVLWFRSCFVGSEVVLFTRFWIRHMGPGHHQLCWATI
jgi:hypothetical protein